MSKNELSFDEFRAVLNREKNLKKNNENDDEKSYVDGIKPSRSLIYILFVDN